ncbi:class I SAM-dependent methyltransferase [Limobrevibacterium gyesilva]|uniref:Class I SAM-dependent methyltransferase n=1 Tax=Limobrevibacterium gyesilva TaxID=2991712 RepID=A0AA42CFX5_9PROT|nr:class I SAM-dependent methyltransferase [Limobrevibacterium gyesilva]MCW3473447.1 class I SAM-dependent methyltransferase [Limobrevibacterium gyesilva]
MNEPDWLQANRANWDERVDAHLDPRAYDLTALRAGRGRLHPIEEGELGPVAGKRVLHLQCHFGADTLTLAQRGAEVVGLDFSPRAIAVARELAAELGLAGRARFVEANVYDAPAAIPEPQGFDLVFVTWGALCWLPDVARWAQVVAWFVKPGGALYLAEGHPAALVLDDETPCGDGRPGFYVPYFLGEALILDQGCDYANPHVSLRNTRQHQFMHPLGEVVTGLLRAGLALEFLHEHAVVPWRMFTCLAKGADGLFRWPDRPWLPLAFSLRAARPGPLLRA